MSIAHRWDLTWITHFVNVRTAFSPIFMGNRKTTQKGSPTKPTIFTLAQDFHQSISLLHTTNPRDFWDYVQHTQD